MGLGAAGGRVAIVMGNGLDICVGVFAAQAAGAQVVPLNPLYTARELGDILEDAAPRIIIHDAAISSVVEPLVGRCGARHAIAIGGADGRRLTRGGPPCELPLPHPDGLATLQYTGGTTGRSKGVICTHAAVAINVAQRDAILPTPADGERILCIAPLYHTYAMAMGLHNAAHSGSTLVIVAKFAPEVVFDVVAKERITILSGSPSIFTSLLKHSGFPTADFRTLRICYSGAAPLPEAVLREWQAATHAPVYEGYGQSESGPVLSFNPLAGPCKPQSVGIPLPETEIEIVDVSDGTTRLPAGAIGEIRARGPQIMAGYRNRPADTASALHDGWLYTGDLGEFDTDGYLYIRDRKKDMVLVSGFNVYPREVEEVLGMHPDVLEAAVIGVPDPERGSRVTAFVVVRAGRTPSAQSLEAHARANLAAYKIPRDWRLVGALPKTAVGKIDKKQLR